MATDKTHIERLIRGKHHDPFEYLGVHRTKDGGLVIRAFLPGARDAWILRDDEPIGMSNIHPEGIFEAVIKEGGEFFDYMLRTEVDGFGTRDFHDPYCYPPVLTEFDLHLIGEGTHYEKYLKLGAHITELHGVRGVHFALWAPNAEGVGVIGNFNLWNGRSHAMRILGGSGIWEIFIPGLGEGDLYKFEIRSGDKRLVKTDPYGFYSEIRPQTASIVWDIEKFEWSDAEWMKKRDKQSLLDAPIAIYEVHLGSWDRNKDGGFIGYRELAHRLVAHAKGLGFTHLELMPIMEHPLDGSWGYQTLGYFAITSRFGTPEDFVYFVDYCHSEGMGVLMDWVPAHFPKDSHGLAQFDGTYLYEHEHPYRREQKDWGTHIFNYGRTEVASFLLNSALFWLKMYHIDGLRVDAVASMLYLDYSREDGQWLPNPHGGNEDLEAVDFIKRFNELCHGRHPGVLTIAEESTAWPMVSRPTYLGGLGFSLKWNMGWMNDILSYFETDPIYRKYHHGDLTFGLIYAFQENFTLPLSHDEVVHGKSSLIGKMPGDEWQKFAGLRLLYGFMYGHPGKKLLFMGAELGQYSEWDFDGTLDWGLLQHKPHSLLMRYIGDLNALYKREPSMHEVDFEHRGFQWLDASDSDASVVSFVRRAKDPGDFMVFVFNFTPVVRSGYRIGVPSAGLYKEVMNSDSEHYMGSNVGNAGGVHSDPVRLNEWTHSLSIELPPLGMLVLKPSRQ